MKRYINHFLLIILFLPLLGSAQVFPVQVTPQMIPPYSLKLSEYSSLGSEKLLLNLVLSDITEPSRQVRLKLFIENNDGLSIQSTDVVIGANPIFIDGGVPLRLSNIDLQPYFLLENLVGITPQQYSTSLPEGLYRFCFEVYDVLSGLRLSRKSCATVYLVLNDPPFLNLPLEGEYVSFKDPQNIIFQWTPRHLNATNVSYEFTLTELWDNQMDPQAAFLASQPLYQTTTFSTTLLYGPTETSLLEDKMYGWRVRAMVNDGISETSVFKNNGYSEIYHFTYTANCDEPIQVISEASDTTSEKIYWQGVDHLQYDMQYRKKGDTGTNNWFNATTLNTYTTIYNLEPNTTYQFRVGGQCIEDGPYAYSQIYEFTTINPEDDETAFDCGITPEIVIANQDPLQQLVINETFTAGDFPVTVKEVTSGNGSYEMSDPEEEIDVTETLEISTSELSETDTASQDKTYSGWGFIEVKYLNDTRIKVSFENIKINTDYQLIEGIVKTDYDKNWGGLVSVDEVLEPFEGDNDLRNIDLDYDITIDHISIADDGSIVITHPTSGATTEYTGGDDTIIMDTNTDKTRDIFHVDADGNIREGGQMAPGGGINPENTSGVNSNGEVTALTAQGIKVEFLEYTDYTYGFDQIPSGEASTLAKYYDQIKDAEGSPYNIINKSVGNGDTDIIRARVTITDATVSISDLVIKTLHGENVEYQITGDNEISLNLKGYYSFEHENIYATIQPEVNKTDKQTIAGVFSQWHLANKDVNLTIIPVNGAELPSEAALAEQINTIYKQASVSFNVSIAPEMYVGKSQIGVGDGSILSNNYTGDQSEIIAQYKQIQATNPKSYYVFVFGNSTRPSKNVAGFMPLKRQFGFVFSSNLTDQTEGKTSLVGTLSHELGHGVFALEHPFSELGTAQGGTDWLQDYGSGTRLSHLDWSQIHNPEFRLYLFQDSEDASLKLYSLTPTWKAFTINGDDNSSPLVIFPSEIMEPNGAVFQILRDGKLYEWDDLHDDYVYSAGDEFDFLKVKKYTPSDIHSTNNLENNAGLNLKLYWNKGDCTKNEIYATSFDFIKDYNGNLDLNNESDAYGILVIDNKEVKNISFVDLSGCSTNASCANVVLADLQPEINELIAISNAINTNANTTSIVDIETKVNGLSICGLKELNYETVRSLLITLMAQGNYTDTDQTERAIVKLMECIPDDKGANFYNTIKGVNSGQVVANAIQKTTNVAFTGFSEGEFSSFITLLADMVALIEGDTEKWLVFNAIVHNKFTELEEGTTSLGLQTLMKSLEDVNEEKQLKVPGIVSLFIDMLEDPNLKTMHSSDNILNDYKIIFDIASIRNENDVFFRSFTLADFITLTRNPDHFASSLPDNIGGDKMDLQISSSQYSWLVPSLEYLKNEPAIKLGEYLYEEDYLSLNSVWYNYLGQENWDASTLNKNPENFLNTFYEQLSSYLIIGNESNSEFWERIGTVDCSNILEVIHHINMNENSQLLKSVNENTRLDFVKTYFNVDCDIPDLGNDRSGALGRVDDSFMKVLISIDQSNEAILAIIEDIGFNTISAKLSHENFTQFITWVSMQIIYSEHFIEIPSNENLYSLEENSNNDLSNLLQLESDIFSFQNFNSDLINKTQIEINAVNGTFYNGEKLNYNQIVLVHVEGSFDFAGRRYEKGEVLVMPLIQAYVLSKENRSIVTSKMAWLTAEVGFFALGVYQLKILWSAGRHLRNLALISEVTGSTIGIVATALNEDAISPELRFRFHMISLVASMPSLFVRSGQVVADNIDYETTKLINDINNTNSSYKTTLIEFIRKLGDNSTTVRNYPTYLPKELRGTLDLDFPNNSWIDFDEGFIRQWINYRGSNTTGKICN